MDKEKKAPLSFRVEESTLELLDRLVKAMQLIDTKAPDWLRVPKNRSELAAYLLRVAAMDMQSDLLALHSYLEGGENRMTGTITLGMAAAKEDLKEENFMKALLGILLQFED